MGLYVLKRVSLFFPTLLLVAIAIFVILRVIPGDPALVQLAGETGRGRYTQEDLQALRHELGTDRNIVVQFGDWIWDMSRGDLGKSLKTKKPVWEEVKQKFPATLEMIFLAFLMSFFLALPLGIISAVRQDTWLDYTSRIFAITGTALPNFWVGVLVIYFLVRIFNWVPPLGYAQIWEDPGKNLSQMIFPALVLGYFNLAFLARVTRSAMLDVLREDYIRTAHAKGLREVIVISRHALKNALLPILTISGWQLGTLIGGTVVLERIFLVPGVGTILITGISNRDFPLIQATVFLVALGVLVLNLIIDIVYSWLDPRIRYA